MAFIVSLLVRIFVFLIKLNSKILIMPRISQKGINMPASPIRKLTPFADQAKREGKKI